MINIYTRDGCPHCTEIKQFLKNRNVDYNEFKIGVDVQREQVLEKFPDQKTLPIITLNEDIIGSPELKMLIENEQLDLFN